MLRWVAPFFAWRALVLACPAWYPNLARTVRDRLLIFAERLLSGHQFLPNDLNALLAAE